MAVGTPAQWRGRLGQRTRSFARLIGGEGDERAYVVQRVDPRQVVLDQLERGDLATTHEVSLLEGGEIMELGHTTTVAPTLTRPL